MKYLRETDTLAKVVTTLVKLEILKPVTKIISVEMDTTALRMVSLIAGVAIINFTYNTVVKLI
jgi:hypothetical protein